MTRDFSSSTFIRPSSLRCTIASFVLVFSLSACESTPTTEIVPVGETMVLVDTPTDSIGDSDGVQDAFGNINAVCDPFANNPTHAGSNLNHGIVGEIFYAPPELPRYTHVVDYQTFGTAIDATLFLNQLNVPTRKFDLGFSTESGKTLTTPNGDTLYEYFSIHFESALGLTPDDPAGPYQFALLADDGAVLQADLGQGFETIVDNDGTHASKLVVSNEPILLNAESRLPIKVDYYQGPRYHIALILMWRPWTENSVEPLNGRSGNSLFFDYNTVPSTPQRAYQDLLARGWKPIGANNFNMPDFIAANPCNLPAPTTSIRTVLPSAAVTNSKTVTLTFDSNYPTSTFYCSLDNAAATACASPMVYENLADGAHQIVIKANNQGRMDPVGATYAWTVDSAAPRITALSSSVTSTSLTINWTTSEPTSTGLLWGFGTATDRSVVEGTELTSTHTITLSGLTANTVYSYVIIGHDPAGNAITNSRRTLRTSP